MLQELMNTFRFEERAEVQASHQPECAAAATYREQNVAMVSQEPATLQRNLRERRAFSMLEAETTEQRAKTQ